MGSYERAADVGWIWMVLVVIILIFGACYGYALCRRGFGGEKVHQGQQNSIDDDVKEVIEDEQVQSNSMEIVA